MPWPLLYSVCVCVFFLLQLSTKCLVRYISPVLYQCMLVLVSGCLRVPICVPICVFPGPQWCIGRQSSLVLCTYRVLITTNSLEPASSLWGIILNPITYRLRYATEAHNLSSSDGCDFLLMSPESQRTNNETRRETGRAQREKNETDS